MSKQLTVSSDVAKLHQILGKKLYSSDYAFISEMVQNAVDSHRKKGQTEPVIVGIKNVADVWWFYVKDFGVGFASIDEFEQKVCTLLESDKEEEKTNDASCETGSNGIGTISVSAYTNEWWYTVVNAGRKFRAMLSDVEDIGLQHNCDEIGYECDYGEDSVTFECAIREGELEEFVNAMIGKLAYFKDILFEFDQKLIAKHKELLTINTYFQLHEADEFTVSTLSQEKDMHIVIDQYHFPIKWKHLGIRNIPVNVGLRFGMGDGLSPDLTRENVKIAPNFKDLLMEKIRKTSTWFIEKYNATIPNEFTDLREYIKAYHNKKGVKILDRMFDVNELAQFSDVPVKELEFRDINDDVIGKFIKLTAEGKYLFRATHVIENGRRNKITERRGFIPGGKEQSFLIKGKVDRKVLNWLKKQEGAYLFEKVKVPLRDKKDAAGYSYDAFMNLFHGKAHMEQLYKGMGVNIWREKIKQFQALEEMAEIENFTVIDSNFVIPV